MRHLVAGTVGVALFAHVAPAATWLAQPTLAVLPRLKGVGRRDHIALTFDDGPDPASTPQFLDALDELGWSATFFLLGEMVRSYPDLAAQIVARGHEVGLHGDIHRSHLVRSPRDVWRDMSTGARTLREATGRPLYWFRPPYGELALSSVLVARRLDLHPVLWSVWGKDWKPGATPHDIVSTVLSGLTGGGTILLHDSDHTSAPGSWRATLQALDILAEHLDPSLSIGPLHEHFFRSGLSVR